jgi:hypothetical protein
MSKEKRQTEAGKFKAKYKNIKSCKVQGKKFLVKIFVVS